MAPFDSLRARCEALAPTTALVLGSGMGAVRDRIAVVQSVAFGEVPGLVASGVQGHRGHLTLGTWAGVPVLLFEGRLHHYEGHAWEVVERPVRLAAALGGKRLVLTNASGGIRADLGPGSMVLVRDHLEWTRPYAWRQPGFGGLGEARPSAYDAGLRQALFRAARQADVPLSEGVYAAVTGPCYETPAEIRALRACGADAVGMSTTREARAAAEMGLRVAAISCVANRAAGLGEGALGHAEVLAVIAAMAGRLCGLLEAFLTAPT